MDFTSESAEQMQLGYTNVEFSKSSNITSILPVSEARRNKRVRKSRHQVHFERPEHARRPQNDENTSGDPSAGSSNDNSGTKPKPMTPFELMEAQEARDDMRDVSRLRKRAKLARRQEGSKSKDEGKELKNLDDLVKKKPRAECPERKSTRPRNNVQETDVAIRRLLGNDRGKGAERQDAQAAP